MAPVIPVSFQCEAEAFLETWQSRTVHQSRLQLARAMEALGAATRYRGLHRTSNPGLRTAADSMEHGATRNQGMQLLFYVTLLCFLMSLGVDIFKMEVMSPVPDNASGRSMGWSVT